MPVQFEILAGISEDLRKGAENIILNLKNLGIRDYSSSESLLEKRVVFPQDGEIFLKNLPHHYKNEYIVATLF